KNSASIAGTFPIPTIGMKNAKIAKLGIVCKIPIKDMNLSANFGARVKIIPSGTATMTPRIIATSEIYKCSNVFISKSMPYSLKNSITSLHLLLCCFYDLFQFAAIAPNRVIHHICQCSPCNDAFKIIVIINDWNIWRITSENLPYRITQQTVCIHRQYIFVQEFIDGSRLFIILMNGFKIHITLQFILRINN